MDNCLSVNCDGEINAGVRSDDDWLPLGGSETALFCSAFSPLLLTPPGFEPPPRSGLFDFDFAAHRTPRRVAAFLLPLDEKATKATHRRRRRRLFTPSSFCGGRRPALLALTPPQNAMLFATMATQASSSSFLEAASSQRSPPIRLIEYYSGRDDPSSSFEPLLLLLPFVLCVCDFEGVGVRRRCRLSSSFFVFFFPIVVLCEKVFSLSPE